MFGGGENPSEGGSSILPINLVSPPSTTSHVAEPLPRAFPGCRGAPRATTGAEPVFAPVSQIQLPTVVHESPKYIVVEESPLPPWATLYTKLERRRSISIKLEKAAPYPRAERTNLRRQISPHCLWDVVPRNVHSPGVFKRVSSVVPPFREPSGSPLEAPTPRGGTFARHDPGPLPLY